MHVKAMAHSCLFKPCGPQQALIEGFSHNPYRYN